MDTEYRKAANLTIVIAGIALLVWLILKYAVGAIMPFLLAAVIAAIISPAAEKLSKKTRIPRAFTSAALVILIFAAACALISFAVSRVAVEAGELIDRLAEDPEVISRVIDGLLGKINAEGSRLGFLRKILESEALTNLGVNVDGLIQGALSSLISSITASLPTAAMGIVSRIPSALFFGVVFLIAAFYFTTDRERIGAGLSSLLPLRWQEKLPALRERISKILTGYCKAYLLIMLITFAEMFIGLSILRVNYAFLLAAVIAVVDILPVLGTGTVLIPWAIFSFITSDIKLGIGLVVLYAAGLLIRQFVEPKIVGTTLGLHPLATLASVYISLELIGFIGILIGPMIALLIKELFLSDGSDGGAKGAKNDKKSPDKPQKASKLPISPKTPTSE